MVGIVLISHGEMANGMCNSAAMFFGETGLQQVASVSLLPAHNPEEFDVMLASAVDSVNSGDGVIILADLLGGTPGNRAAYLCSEKIQVITGMNLPIFLELLGARMSGNADVDALISVGREGIMSLNKLMEGR